MTAIDDSWEKVYKTTQAYNYEKREETFITNTTSEEALRNADQLIESEETAKSKAERKEAKKKRQKEKKKAEKTSNGLLEAKTLTDTAKSMDSNETTKTNETVIAESSKEQSEYSDQEEQIDDDFLDINAAFVKVSVKQNKNVVPSKTSAPKPEKIVPSSDSIPVPKILKPKMTKGLLDEAVMLGMQSYYLALNNNDFERAIELLSQAIFVAPEDVRHLLNRSYCYLRLGQFSLALSDARLAKKKSQLSEHFSKAVACVGQALCGLQQYHKAEKCYEKILKLEGGNEWILTELIVVRASQLVNMGFSMMSALTALQQCSSVVDAVTLLTSGSISSTKIETKSDKSETENCDGNEIYFSDDESSSTTLLSKLVSAIEDESCYLEDLRSQPSSSKTRQSSISSEKSLTSSTSMESIPRSSSSIKSNGSVQWEMMRNVKSAPSISKNQAQKSTPNENSSIWVGNIDKSVSEYQLRELFGVFGDINYIRRFSDERNYAFIDFKSKKAATKALSNRNNFEINGVKLPVGPSGFSGKK